jgi:hypothetical protein
MAASSSRRFLRSAPSRADKRRSVDLRVTNMSTSDALWWDARLGPKHAAVSARADRFWSWSVLLPLCHLVQRAKGRYCRPLVVWARTDSGRFLRVGMSILIEEYPYLDVARDVAADFLWFISAADPAVLTEQFGMSNPPLLGRVLIDNARAESECGTGRSYRFACSGSRRRRVNGDVRALWTFAIAGDGPVTTCDSPAQ